MKRDEPHVLPGGRHLSVLKHPHYEVHTSNNSRPSCDKGLFRMTIIGVTLPSSFFVVFALTRNTRECIATDSSHTHAKSRPLKKCATVQGPSASIGNLIAEACLR
jgi:hypothetical protein